MNQRLLKAGAPALALIALMTLAGCINVNQDVVVGDGETVSGGLSTINGAIRVGANAEVEGTLATVNGNASIGEKSTVASVQTVNGRIEIAHAARAAELQTVNGSISLLPNAHVTGDVSTINGSISLESGARVDGKASAINGLITLDNAEAGSIVNYNGGMHLKDGSVVFGELRVRRPSDPDQGSPPRIIIGADCRVEGPLVFEREVELFVHETAEIGSVRGAEPRSFTGDHP
jgi:hypothetical protein